MLKRMLVQILLAFSVLGAVTVYANPVIDIASIDVNTGGNFAGMAGDRGPNALSIPVSLINDPAVGQVASLGFAVKYDPMLLEFNGAQSLDPNKQASSNVTDPNRTPGEVKVLFAGINNNAINNGVDGPIVNLRFNILPGATPQDSTVTLTADPQASTPDALPIPLDNGNQTAAVTIMAASPGGSLSLIIVPVSSGTATTDPIINANIPYNIGNTVNLSASPAAGYTFTNWSCTVPLNSNATTAANSISIIDTSDVMCTANFALITYNLTLNTNPTSKGTFTTNPVPASITGSIFKFVPNTSVEVTFTPASGYVFAGWSGATCPGAGSTTNPLTALLDISRTCTANVKGIPVITWANPSPITYGTALSATQLNATASAPGTFVYTPAGGTILNAGLQQPLKVDFTPTDAAAYISASKTVLLDVNKATPIITWADPAPIAYGTALSATQLNPIANVPGAFVFTPAGGTTLNAGPQQPLKADFTPTDSANYTNVSTTVHITVIPPPQCDTPTLIISALPDGSRTKDKIFNLSGTVSDKDGIASFTINGVDMTPIPNGNFSYAFELILGENTFVTVVTDVLNCSTTDTRKIIYDPNGPQVTITEPADNSKTKELSIPVNGTVIDEDATVKVAVNGGDPKVVFEGKGNFSTLVDLTANMLNTIIITAADSLGNETSIKRSVTQDSIGPDIAITDPPTDIKTTKSSYLLKGTVSADAVSVTLTMDGTTFHPDIMNGAFEQELSLPTTTTYHVTAMATDDVGNPSPVVQRNIIKAVCAPATDCKLAEVNNPDTGECQPAINKEDGTSCADADLCNGAETCQAGVCTAGTAVTCPIATACTTVGTCNTATGICPVTNKSNGTNCDDGNLCNGVSTCVNGSCNQTTPPVTCTAPLICNTATGLCGCTLDSQCTGDSCNTGACVSNNCVKTRKDNGTSCDDGNLCNGIETCQSGVCKPGTAKTCAAATDCKEAEVCNTSTGACDAGANKLDGTTCTDNNACTINDACSSGVCKGTLKDCDDNNVCTINWCFEPTGECVFSINTTATSCDDNNKCTENDRCSAQGTCVGTPKTCPSGETCNPINGICESLCVGQPDGKPCNDFNACTTDEACQSGVCTGGKLKTCLPATACTEAGVCNTATGACEYANKPNGTSCADADLCNGAETCQGGVCTAGTAVNCNDNDACTTDTCVNGTCVFTLDCSLPGCSGTPACDKCANVICNDNGACTTGKCNTATGACEYANKPNGTSCADANHCNGAETCQGGACTAGTAVICSGATACKEAGVCNTSTGSCEYANKSNGTSCADANLCNGAETCQGGLCAAGTPVNCDDGNACTTDTCNSATGLCVNTTKTCDDNNICTFDSCNTSTGMCLHISKCSANQTCDPETGACIGGCTTNDQCNDNNACTTDICASGTCQHGPVSCIHTVCETAACDPAIGCVRTPISCDDGDSCTTDTCNPASGCVHTNTCGKGPDAAIVRFAAPAKIKDCRYAVPIQIRTVNIGKAAGTGSIVLSKNGHPVKTWSNVKLFVGKNVNRIYLYNPRGDGGSTVQWSVEVIVPGDTNHSNDTATATMKIADCGHKGNKSHNGRDDDHDDDHGNGNEKNR